MKNPIIKTILQLTVFSIAMGFLETAVVFYIRKLYYPDGFDFPLVPITKDIAITEFWREVATIVMLAGIGIIAGKNRQQRFAFFIYCFAIWDIFYYVFLYVLLGWPQSLFTWDILFLIPVPWVGPVLCPCLVSLTMIALAFVIVYAQEKGLNGKTNRTERWIMLVGCALILVSFMWDYVSYVMQHHSEQGPWSYSLHKDLFSEAVGYVPSHFNWMLYLPGQVMLIGGVALFWLRMRKGSRTAIPSSREWKQV